MNRFEIMDTWLTPTVLFCIINLMIATIFLLKPHEKLKKLTEARVPIPFMFQRVRSTYRSDNQPDRPVHQETYHVAHEEPVHQFYVDEARTHVTRSNSDPVQEHDDEARSHVTRSKSDPVRKETEPAHQETYTAAHAEPVHKYDGEARSNVTVSNSNPDRKETEPVHQETYTAAHVEPVHEYDGASRSHVRRKSDMVQKKPVKKVLKKSFSEKLPVMEAAEEVVMDVQRPATMREKMTASQGDEAVDSKADDFISMFRKQLKLQRLGSVNLRYTDMMKT